MLASRAPCLLGESVPNGGWVVYRIPVTPLVDLGCDLFGEGQAAINRTAKIAGRDVCQCPKPTNEAIRILVGTIVEKGWQENTAYTLEARNKVQAVAYAFKAGQGAKAQGIGWQEECAPTLSAGESGTQRSPGLLQGSAVRRLTPRECERLQGFPDDYTQIPWRGKDADQCPDGPRYKALGNSMAVPCMSWLGQRINSVDALVKELSHAA